jgi:hypothetical protein
VRKNVFALFWLKKGKHAVLSTPLSVGLGTTVGFIFQNLGPTVTYQLGTYALTITINTSTPLSVSTLTNSGVGLGFLRNATTTSRGTEALSSQTTPAALSLSAFTGTTQTLTFTFNNSTVTTGNVGLEMFSGNGSLLSAGAFGWRDFWPIKPDIYTTSGACSDFPCGGRGFGNARPWYSS